MAIAEPFIATVGRRRIPRQAVEQRLEELRRGPRGRHVPPGDGPEIDVLRRWIVQELVHEEIVRQAAQAAGLVAREDGCATGAIGGEDAAGRTGLADGLGGASEGDGEGGSGRADPEADDGTRAFDAPGLSPEQVRRLVALVTDDVRVDEEEVRGYHERNPDLFRRPESRRVTHVLLTNQEVARDIARRAGAGEDLGTLARLLSMDAGSRDRRGDIGEIRRGELAGPLEEALFRATPGELVGPIRTQHGWHVARVEAVTAESLVSVEEARPAIVGELLEAARLRAFDAWLERRRAAIAVLEPGFEHPGDPTHGVRTHRH